VSARAVALEALGAIDQGAYANLVVPAILERGDLERRDRDLVTELVYGTTRMRRACDWLVDRRAKGTVEPVVRRVLRLGAYQLGWLRVPAHAAVSSTVDIAPKRARGFVNAVLRAVARDVERQVGWPDRATELSYPDWIVRRLIDDLGGADAYAALDTMNLAPPVTTRDDGYVQDLASQWVAASVDAGGQRVLDVCAGPGGKATAMSAAPGAFVVAGDPNVNRARLVAGNARRLRRTNVATIVADGRRPPVPPATFGRVLVDAPCSGLGVLRRRPDARWRVQPDDVATLAGLQREILTAALPQVGSGGVLVYSVCTMTKAETTDIDDWLLGELPELEALPPPEDPWRAVGRGALLLPQDAGTDGMYVLRLRVRAAPLRIPEAGSARG
jgi:16S rRNA (cytosine967-C5)-methyltransferase